MLNITVQNKLINLKLCLYKKYTYEKDNIKNINIVIYLSPNFIFNEIIITRCFINEVSTRAIENPKIP